MSEPRTEAGRRLLRDMGFSTRRWSERAERLTAYIVAIEAEAAAKERERILAAVRALPHWDMGAPAGQDVGADCCNWHAVLALLEGDDAS